MGQLFNLLLSGLSSAACCCPRSLAEREDGFLNRKAFLGSVVDFSVSEALRLCDGPLCSRGGSGDWLSTARVSSRLIASVEEGSEDRLGRRGALSDCDRT